MPRVSRHSLPHRQEKELSQNFSYLISSLHNQGQIERFLDEFLTTEEKNMLSKRFAMFIMLHQNVEPSSIQARLSLSRETVRIYQQQFPLKSKIFRDTISHLIRMEKVNNFLTATGEVLETILTSKTNMKSRSKLLQGKLR